MPTIQFTKMHGLGNDFVVIDTLRQTCHITPELIRSWSNRHLGIGFDQLLLLSPPTHKNMDATYQIFNADGSEVGQCGNGARCAGRYLVDKGLMPEGTIKLQTHSTHLHVIVKPNNPLVSVTMECPQFSPKALPFIPESKPNKEGLYQLNVLGQTVKFGIVSIGNPHIVIFVSDVEQVDTTNLGAALENHPAFPQKVNVGFAEIQTQEIIKLRVFERGVGETLACGSGACAAAAVAFQLNKTNKQVQVDLKGGKVGVHWPGKGHTLSMQGPTNAVFEGQITVLS